MTGLTIVAIPSQDDYVWRLSSEKVPHMTILQLGDTDKVGRIFEYIEHVADMTMTRFGMSVDHRGTLGPKEADVLFFDKRYAKNLCDVRTYLLQSPDIRTAYDSIEQYEEWVPHLTMGYPATPAKEDTRDYPGTSWVNFDKLALWVDDYQGPEIELKTNGWGEMRMSEDDEEFIDDILNHHGIRGMKWGVRKSAGGGHGGVSEDHTNAIAARVKAKHGGVKALSNKELQDLVTRMNLEQQYVKVIPPSKSARFTRAGAKVVGDILLNVGKAQATKLATDHVTKLVAKGFKKP